MKLSTAMHLLNQGERVSHDKLPTQFIEQVGHSYVTAEGQPFADREVFNNPDFDTGWYVVEENEQVAMKGSQFQRLRKINKVMVEHMLNMSERIRIVNDRIDLNNQRLEALHKHIDYQRKHIRELTIALIIVIILYFIK